MSTAPAAIAAVLVSMKNIGVHKSVALTIHVPEEHARAVIDVFGWPTMTSPVPVAIARLNETPAEGAGQDGEVATSGSPTEGGRAAASPSVPKKAWHEMRLGQQAGIRCAEESFRRYLAERGDCAWRDQSEDWAAEVVRIECGVKSRSKIDASEFSRWKWNRLDTDYLVWSGKMADPRR